ncbi:hypothetical protein CXB51_025059 [Gossypium anomalum]|uniref:GAG-pre-integrase domain-containing protein n=1 Tax=Gossypium anomalum TaxID=47600 RepID=A0A8J5Y163_9ROSI|nr:hypothetical protein CXB51_025059 [Gossypium anomalum]
MENFVLAASAKDDSKLWHSRYGHLNIKGLKLLSDKGMVLGLPKIGSLDLCEGCIYKKQTRKSFPVGKAWRATECLELIHADLCGPMQTESLGGSCYFLLFTGDYSRMSWPVSLTRPQHGRVLALCKIMDILFLTLAFPKCHTAMTHTRVLGRVLKATETHGCVSARVFITMHTNLKFLRAWDTQLDYTSMGQTVCHTRPRQTWSYTDTSRSRCMSQTCLTLAYATRSMHIPDMSYTGTRLNTDAMS